MYDILIQLKNQYFREQEVKLLPENDHTNNPEIGAFCSLSTSPEMLKRIKKTFEKNPKTLKRVKNKSWKGSKIIPEDVY